MKYRQRKEATFDKEEVAYKIGNEHEEDMEVEEMVERKENTQEDLNLVGKTHTMKKREDNWWRKPKEEIENGKFFR